MLLADDIALAGKEGPEIQKRLVVGHTKYTSTEFMSVLNLSFIFQSVGNIDSVLVSRINTG